MRRHGPFEPHRLPADEMEYTSLPGVLKMLEDRMQRYGLNFNPIFLYFFSNFL